MPFSWSSQTFLNTCQSLFLLPFSLSTMLRHCDMPGPCVAFIGHSPIHSEGSLSPPVTSQSHWPGPPKPSQLDPKACCSFPNFTSCPSLCSFCYHHFVLLNFPCTQCKSGLISVSQSTENNGQTSCAAHSPAPLGALSVTSRQTAF